MIRNIQPQDREVFIALGQEFYHSEAVLSPIPAEHFARTFDAVLSGSPYADALMVEWNGKPVGYGILALTWSNEAGGMVVWLEELYISPAYRGKGLGREFFAYVEEHYGQRARRFRLEVTAENTEAIRLYKQLGYQDFHYLQMVKELP